jgi:hypothetical protein
MVAAALFSFMATDRRVNIVLPLDYAASDAHIEAFVRAAFPQVTGIDVLESEPAILEIDYQDEQDIGNTIYEAIWERFGFPDDEGDFSDGEDC